MSTGTAQGVAQGLWSVLQDVDYRCSSIQCMSCYVPVRLGFLSLVLALGVWVGWVPVAFPSVHEETEPLWGSSREHGGQVGPPQAGREL